MGQHHSTHHEPLERAAAARRSLRHSKPEKGASPRRMDRLRRSFRDSFRRRKEHVPESSKPHQWQADEACVRAGTCSFHVKYLGCVEVFESRGMQVCEEALKVLRNSRRRPVKAELFVSGDGLRVVEDETKGLIVDQTIEKVSFCAPDRNHEKGFSYICRDGTTRRWMCHGFLALKETGERLSHAVGCAFAACLERKQKRDKECGVTMTFDPKNSTFTRSGSFRQTSLTERLQDPQEVKPAVEWGGSLTSKGVVCIADPPPVKAVFNPYAIERPHATVSMLQRQGSFRGFQQLNQASPFKRQMSLRISELPSNLERQRSLSLESSDLRLPVHMKAPVSPIPESSPQSDKSDSVSAMCQQLSQGLSLLSSNDDFLTDVKKPTPAVSSSTSSVSTVSVTTSVVPASNSVAKQLFHVTTSSVPVSASPVLGISSDTAKLNNNNNIGASPVMWTGGQMASGSPRIPWRSPALPPRSTPTPPPTTTAIQPAPVMAVVPSAELPRPDQWLGSIVNATKGPPPSPRRAPHLSQHLRAHSLGSAESYMAHNGQAFDPFDAEWAAVAARREASSNNSTNPFLTGGTVKAFQVQM